MKAQLLSGLIIALGLASRPALAQVPPFGDIDGACSDPGFPQFMAFRAFDQNLANFPYLWNSGPDAYQGTGQTSASLDWPCVDVAVDRNDSELEVLESSSSGSITTFYHSAWGTISNGWLEPALDELTVAGTSVPVSSALWLYEAGGIVTITGDSSACVIETDGVTGDRLTEDQGPADDWDVVVYPAITSANNPVTDHVWADARHYRITSYSVDGGTGDYTFVVDTGEYDGQSDFCADLSTGSEILWMATHARLDHTGTQIAWAVNLSYGVEDGAGRRGDELMTEILEARWDGAYGASSDPADGMQLDMARWRPDQGGAQRYPIDADNDGHPDYGFVQGTQRYGIGGVLHVWDLGGLGVDLIVDSSAPWWGYRGTWGVVGAEIENFPEAAQKSTSGYYPNSWTAFSSAFQHLSYWLKEADVVEPLSYGLTKAETAIYYDCNGAPVPCTTSTAPSTNASFRVGLAANTLLGMPHGYAVGPGEFHLTSWPQYFGGAAASWGWLGDPVDDAARAEDPSTGTNLLGVGYDSGDWTAWSVSSCDQDPAWDVAAPGTSLSTPDSATVELDVTEVCNVPRIDDIQLRLDFANSTIAAGDQSFTVKFDVMMEPDTVPLGLDFLEDINAIEALGTMPRLMRVRLILSSSRGYEQDVLVPQDSAWHTIYLTFQDVSWPSTASLDRLRIYVGEQTGVVSLKNVGLYAGSADIWQREFDGGFVLLNMSDAPYTYELSCADDLIHIIDGDNAPDADGEGATIPETSGLCEVEVPEHDAAFLRYDLP